MMKIKKLYSIFFFITLLAKLNSSPFGDFLNEDTDTKHANKNDFDNTSNNNNNNPDNDLQNEYSFRHSNTNFDDRNSAPSDDSGFDPSIFGNTDESFFEFANRRVNELKNQNKQLYDKSIASCQYSPKTFLDTYSLVSRRDLGEITLENDYRIAEDKSSMRQSCQIAEFSLNDLNGKTSDRIFIYDPLTIGLVSSSDSTLRFYTLNILHKTFTLVRTKYFKNEVPFDACSDKYKNIYVVFPDQNKIGKYQVNQTFVVFRNSQNTRFTNKSRIGIKETISVKDIDFRPSAIACHDDIVYVSEKGKNQIRVYDKLLRLVRIISLNGMVSSPYHALAVNQNVRVLLDGMDGVALFNPHNHVKSLFKKKFQISHENNNINVCHFYSDVNCLEDVHVSAESHSKSNVFVADSCSNEIKQFTFSKDERIKLSAQFSVPNGRPISMVTLPVGYIIVLTDSPRKLYVLNPRECNQTSKPTVE